MSWTSVPYEYTLLVSNGGPFQIDSEPIPEVPDQLLDFMARSKRAVEMALLNAPVDNLNTAITLLLGAIESKPTDVSVYLRCLY